MTDCRVCKSQRVAWYCWQAQNHCIFVWFAQDVFAEQLTVGFVNLNGLVGIAGRRRITAYLRGLHWMCLLNN